MLSWRAPVFLLSVYLLLLLPGDTSALKMPFPRGRNAATPTPTVAGECNKGNFITPTLKLFNKDNQNGIQLTCPFKRGSDLSLVQGSTGGGSRGSRGSTGSRTSTTTTFQGPTAVVMHGFKSNGQKMEAKGFVKAYRETDVNLIIVDWSGLASPGLNGNAGYASAAACAIEVGKYLAKCLNDLNVDPSSLHLLGHSLGAHGVGMAGRELANKHGRKPSRVTGMDPAGPGFTSAKGFRNGVSDNGLLNILKPYEDLEKISQDSGVFVDIVHSNVGTYGYAEPLGHVDYYVNGGGPLQEECKKGFQATGIVAKDHIRSHGYAINVVVASLKKENQKIIPCKIVKLLYPKKSYTCNSARGSTSSRGGSDLSISPRQSSARGSTTSRGGSARGSKTSRGGSARGSTTSKEKVQEFEVGTDPNLLNRNKQPYETYYELTTGIPCQ